VVIDRINGVVWCRDRRLSTTSCALGAISPARLYKIPETVIWLDEMLGKVADQYEMQVDNAVDSISSLIEPMIMSVLGVLIGGLMIAMYLPIFMLDSVM